MYQIKTMLEAMGLTVVDEQKPDDYGTVNRGHIVIQVEDRFYKTTYTVDSYGGELEIEGTKQVAPKPVEKVEYV